MARMEERDLNAHRAQLARDVAALGDQDRATVAWDGPEVDEAAADALTGAAIRQALDNMEQALPGAGTP